MAPRINLRDDQLYTNPLPGGSWLIGGQSSADAEPTAFSRESVLEYIQAELAAVASSGSASDLTTGTLPLGRLHAHLQQISSIEAPASGGILYFDADAQQFDLLSPGPSGRFLKALGPGANPIWDTPPATDWVSAADYGVAGDGVTNDSAAINTFLAYCASANRTAWFPDGTYKLNSRIELVSNLNVICSPSARFLRYFQTAGGFGMITQADPTTKISNVRWQSGSFGSPDNTNDSYAGNIFSLYGDDITLDRVKVDFFGSPAVSPGVPGSRALILRGNRIHVLHPRVTRPNPNTGNGGIRFLGGDGFLCYGGYVESGDDVFMFVPSGAAQTDDDITNGAYIGCTGFSYSARLIAVYLGRAPIGITSSVIQTASIRNCSFISVKGTGASGRAVIIQNTDSAGVIEGITFAYCSFSGTPDDSANGVVYVLGMRCGGGIKNIDFYGCNVQDVGRTAIKIDGAGTTGLLPDITDPPIRDVMWTGGEIEAPDNGSAYCVQVQGADNISFRDATLIANGNDALQIGTIGTGTSYNTRNAVVDNCAIRNIPNGQYGIRIDRSSGAIISRCAFYGASGATTANGILNSNTYTTATSVSECDMTQLGGTGLLVGNPYTGGSMAEGVRGPSYTIRDHMAGIKAADETRNTTTLADDTELKVTLPPGAAKWRIYGQLRYNENGSSGFLAFKVYEQQVSSTWNYAVAFGTGSGRSTGSTTNTSAQTNERICNFDGTLITGANGDTITVQWAQNAAAATGTTMRLGSYIRAERIA